MAIFALDRLLDSAKTLKTNLPAQGIVTLMKQSDRLICHLLYASPIKRGNGIEVIEDIVPIYDVDKKINKVYLAPQKEDIDFTYENGYISVKLDKIECHQMVVFE